MKSSYLRLSAVVVYLVFLLGRSGEACTGMYAGKKATVDGTILIGRTMDQAPWNASHRICKTPAGGAVQYPYISIPKISALGGGYDGACANEAGVAAVGTITAHATQSALKADPYVKNGVREHNFLPMIISVSSTAREAVATMGRIIAERGHFGSEIYMVADCDEAWYIEVYTGHQWAAVRMPEDKVSCFGNQFMIRSYDPDSADAMHSPELITLAEKNGFLKKGPDGLPDLYMTYSIGLGDYSNFRTWFGHRTFAPSEVLPETAPYHNYKSQMIMPQFFKPDKKLTAKDFFELMRTRFEGVNCPEENGKCGVRTIGCTKQQCCEVIQINGTLPKRFAASVWYCLAQAQHSVFIPVNAATTEIIPAFNRDSKGGFSYDPERAGDAFCRLATLAEAKKSDYGKDVRHLYGKGIRDFWAEREDDLLARWPKCLADAAKANDAAKVTAFTGTEHARALADARRIFDELMWYMMANNRIAGDGSGATTIPQKPFVPSRRK